MQCSARGEQDGPYTRSASNPFVRRGQKAAEEWTEEDSLELLRLLGQKHVLTILWSLFRKEPLRFNELQSVVDINPTSLTDRLRSLAKQGLIERRVAHVIP